MVCSDRHHRPAGHRRRHFRHLVPHVRGLVQLSRAPLGPRADAGLTLIEALIAVVLGALVVTALGFAHRSLRRTLSATIEREAPRAEALAAMDRLAADLRCAWDDGVAQTPALRAGTDPDGGYSLSFLALLRTVDEADPRYARPHAVEYETHAESSGGWTLARRVTPRRAAANATPASARSLARLVLFRMEFFDGKDWSDGWPAESGPRLPRAARVEFLDRDGRPGRVEIWIARDTEFTPSAAGLR